MKLIALLMLALVALCGCTHTGGTGDLDTAKDGIAVITEGVLVPDAPQDGSGAFVWLAWIGVACIVLGAVAAVVGSHPAISWIGGSKYGIAFACVGLAMACIGYVFPMYAHLVGVFIAQNMGIAAIVLISIGALYAMRKMSLKSGYNAGYHEGYKDGQLGTGVGHA